MPEIIRDSGAKFTAHIIEKNFVQNDEVFLLRLCGRCAGVPSESRASANFLNGRAGGRRQDVYIPHRNYVSVCNGLPEGKRAVFAVTDEHGAGIPHVYIRASKGYIIADTGGYAAKISRKKRILR